MRSSAGRTDKYSKKLRALVLPGQTARYAPTAADRLHLEYCVKKEAITPMLQFSYVAFCEELIKHEANKRPEEATGIYNKWLNRGLDATTLQSVASCIGVSIVIPVPPPCPWSWKRKLTFSGNVSGTNLDDFPVLVHLTVANFDFNKAKNNGEDIRFMDSDTCPSDGTPLKHEIELWDKPGANAWVWVKVPRISTGVADFIYMFYGNAAAADGQDINNTWNANYMLVLHMLGNGTTNLPDSTSYGADGTKTEIGGPANIAAGQINGAQHFDATNDIVTVVDNDSICKFGGPFTVEFWVKLQSTEINTYLMSKGMLAGGYMNLRIYVPPAPAIQVYGTHVTGAWWIDLRDANALPDTDWHHVAVTRDGTTAKLYVDGVLKDTDSTANCADSDDTPLYIGTNRLIAPFGFQGYHDGDMDEFRTSDVARSTDWVMATVRSETEVLITYGAEEAV